MKNKYIKIYNQLDKKQKKYFNNIWKNQSIRIGGVINYKSGVSNGIKLFTQSIFSHVNFFDIKSLCTIGAEDLQSVLLRDYKNENYGEFYYVAKKIDLDYLGFIFSFDYIEDIFVRLGKFKNKGKLKNKFIKYVTLRQKTSNNDLEKILSFDFDNVKISANLKKHINKFFDYKHRLKTINKFDVYFDSSFHSYYNFLKEFILLGFLKHMLLNIGKKYDLHGTLSTAITPWKSINLGQKDYFCSEFVAETFLFGGVYPFDIGTKDPQGISPGDLMDMTVLYDGSATKFYKINPLENPKISQVNSNGFIKNYVIDIEEKNMYFSRQKIFVGAVDKFINLLSTHIMDSKKTQKSNKKSIVMGIFSILGLGIGYVIGISRNNQFVADINLNNSLGSEFLIDIGNVAWHGLKLGVFLAMIFLVLIVVFYFLVPFVKSLFSK